MKDAEEKEVSVGDRIVTTDYHSKGPQLKFGTVVGFGPKMVSVNMDGAAKATSKMPHNICVVPKLINI